jgi:hypothetical protein
MQTDVQVTWLSEKLVAGVIEEALKEWAAERGLVLMFEPGEPIHDLRVKGLVAGQPVLIDVKVG